MIRKLEVGQVPKYMTKQRKALLRYLSQHADETLSAKQIEAALSGEGISISAVYRNLSELEREGKIRRVNQSGSREVFYQYTDGAHCRECLHLSCEKCGKTYHMKCSCKTLRRATPLRSTRQTPCSTAFAKTAVKSEEAMKKIIAILLAAVLLTAAFAGCSGKKPEDGKLKIITTIFPVYEWVSHVTAGTQNTDVSLLLNKGVDMHSFQPTTKDIVNISDCDVFVYVGGESDKWVEDVLRDASNKNMLTLNLMDALGDEHIWLSLKNASVLTAHIAEKLGEKDAANKSAYEKNAEDYTAALNKLDSRYAEAVRAAKHDTLIFADRFPFRYMTSDYNLKYYAAFSGCSAESEASFKTLVFLADKLKELQLYKLMILDGSDGKIARAVIDTAGVADVKILTLNSMQSEIGENDSYLGIMENNLTVLQQALN